MHNKLKQTHLENENVKRAVYNAKLGRNISLLKYNINKSSNASHGSLVLYWNLLTSVFRNWEAI